MTHMLVHVLIFVEKPLENAQRAALAGLSTCGWRLG